MSRIKYHHSDLEVVGKTFKSTGIQGHIVAELNEGLFDVIDDINYMLVMYNGQSLPLFVEEMEDREENVLIKFENIDDPEAAQQLSHKDLYLDKEQILKLCIDTTAIVGEFHDFKLYNGETLVGQIAEIVPFPAQDMIVLSERPDVMIPMVEDWITKVDLDKKEIWMIFDPTLLTMND